LSAFYLQTAMTVPPDAYGGPLLDVHGDVIGVLAPGVATLGVLAAHPRFGIEYAMPSKIVEGLYRSIRQVKTFRSPWLGFSVMSRAELAAQRGVEAFNALSKPKNGILIENVFRPSPAADAGILPGDFLVGFDAYKVSTPVDFQKYMYLAGVGKSVKLEIFRAGETLSKELAITARPPEAVPR
jgi:S1-C subfamily serine protease